MNIIRFTNPSIWSYKGKFDWCIDKFGTCTYKNFTNGDGTWYYEANFEADIFYFKNDHDAVLFKLRWV